jgi:phosphoglycolate phosphatase
MGAGQFCTNPGIAVVIDGPDAQGFVDAAKDALAQIGPQTMLTDGIAEAYRAAWTTVGEPAIEPFPGIFDLLDRCRARGDRLAIATGKSRRGLDRAIARWDLLRWFEATRTVDCVLHGKPAPDMVVSLLDALGVPARRATVIGDTAWDLRMAHGAGAHAIGCTWGAHGPDTLRGEQPLAIVETLAELDALLQAGA